MPDVFMKQNWGNSQLLCFLLPLWYNPGKVVINMEPKEILLKLSTKRGLSQEQLAEQVHVTPLGGLPMGDRRNGAQHRNFETALQAV